jgi:hypothetical protein
MAGVFISRGMTVAIPPGGFTIGIGADGNATSSLVLHVRFDVCPTWIEIALAHLNDAKERRAAGEVAWTGSNEDDKAATLEREFEASMRAIMAAAIAIDAFYALVQAHVKLPPSLVARWRTKRTARYTQVTEVVRRAFQLRPKGTAALRQNLKEIYRLRDLAVHPSGKIEAPILHPELNVGVEWRFAYFRAHNAEIVVNAATWILWDLAHNGKPGDTKIREYLGSLRQRLAAAFPNGHPTAAIAAPPP